MLWHHQVHSQCGKCRAMRASRRPVRPAQASLWPAVRTTVQTPVVKPAHRPHTATSDTLPSSVFTLLEPKAISSPACLTVPMEAMPTLFPQSRSMSRASSAVKPGKRSPDSGAANDGQQQHTTLQVVLTLQIDGVLSGRQELVDLRMYPSKRTARVYTTTCFDLLEGRLLLGWKRDTEGRLVALLATPAGAKPALPAAHAPTPVKLDPNSTLNIHALPHDAPMPEADPAGQQQLQGPPQQHPVQHHGVQQPQGWSNISASNLMQRIGSAGMQMQQQLASSAANAAALISAAGVAGATAVLNRARGAGERHRTYVPARIRPVMNEVYVPFGLWRDLFDGSDRPFPKDGLPLRVTVTGAVHMAEQPAVLVRRITPYGYYVFRGIKGLNRLKGKLMVRWSLLVNGVLELEVAAPNTPEQLPQYTTKPGQVDPSRRDN